MPQYYDHICLCKQKEVETMSNLVEKTDCTVSQISEDVRPQSKLKLMVMKLVEERITCFFLTILNFKRGVASG
jgi:hypothetical protein